MAVNETTARDKQVVYIFNESSRRFYQPTCSRMLHSLPVPDQFVTILYLFMRFLAISFLEQLVERRSRVCWRPRGGLALDDSSWDEQFAGVACLFVDDACGDWLAALEAGARIEIRALTASVQVGFAVWTRAFEENVRWRLCSAVGTFDRFAKRHHFWRARPFAIERL